MNIRLSSISCLMALMLIGLFGVAIGAEEEKSPSTFFESPFVALDMEFDIESIDIGPVTLAIPFPKESTIKVRKHGADDTGSIMISVVEDEKPIFSIAFKLDNIKKNTGEIYIGVREYVFSRYVMNKLGDDAGVFLSGSNLICDEIFPSTFESNDAKGYLFRTRTICQIGDKGFIINLSDGAALVDGYFLTFMIIDYNPDEVKSKTLISSWFHEFRQKN